jgi:hypothetical protein
VPGNFAISGPYFGYVALEVLVTHAKVRNFNFAFTFLGANKGIYEYNYLSTALQPLWTMATFFQFLNTYTIGRTPWTGDQPVARPLPTHRSTQTQNKPHTGIHASSGI